MGRTVNFSALVHGAASYCTRSMAEIRSVEEIAENAGVSLQKLRRGFFRILGVTPLEHLSRMRMEKIRRLLAATDLSCKHIGLAVGLDDEIRLCKFFKQREGITMTEYRRKARMEFSQSEPIPTNRIVHALLYQNAPNNKPEHKTLAKRTASREPVAA